MYVHIGKDGEGMGGAMDVVTSKGTKVVITYNKGLSWYIKLISDILFVIIGWVVIR